MSNRVIVIVLPEATDLKKELEWTKAGIDEGTKVFWATDEDADTVLSVFDLSS